MDMEERWRRDTWYGVRTANSQCIWRHKRKEGMNQHREQEGGPVENGRTHLNPC